MLPLMKLNACACCSPSAFVVRSYQSMYNLPLTLLIHRLVAPVPTPLVIHCRCLLNVVPIVHGLLLLAPRYKCTGPVAEVVLVKPFALLV